MPAQLRKTTHGSAHRLDLGRWRVRFAGPQGIDACSGRHGRGSRHCKDAAAAARLAPSQPTLRPQTHARAIPSEPSTATAVLMATGPGGAPKCECRAGGTHRPLSSTKSAVAHPPQPLPPHALCRRCLCCMALRPTPGSAARCAGVQMAPMGRSQPRSCHQSVSRRWASPASN